MKVLLLGVLSFWGCWGVGKGEFERKGKQGQAGGGACTGMGALARTNEIPESNKAQIWELCAPSLLSAP